MIRGFSVQFSPKKCNHAAHSMGKFATKLSEQMVWLRKLLFGYYLFQNDVDTLLN